MAKDNCEIVAAIAVIVASELPGPVSPLIP